MTIKELRESKGLSQGKFAESIGIGRTAIVGYEKGKFKPSAEVAAKIKEVYGVDISTPTEEAKSAAPAEDAAPKKKGNREKEEPKPTKRGKKKEAAPAVEETAPAVEAKPAKRTRKKAAPAPVEENTPAAAEEKNIAATIKALRMGKGLSQKAFGESIGVKLPTVGAYEQGRIKPSEAVITVPMESRYTGRRNLTAIAEKPIFISAPKTQNNRAISG